MDEGLRVMVGVKFGARVAAIAGTVAALGACAAASRDAPPPADRVPLDSAAATKVVTTASGLRYNVVASGAKTGRMPVDGDSVTFDYEGKLLDGTVFDSSFARGEPISGEVGSFVPGFTEALKAMRPGDEWVVWIPPALGYGAEASGPIPGNSTLRLRMRLKDVQSGAK